jgi:hypothetical protein
MFRHTAVFFAIALAACETQSPAQDPVVLISFPEVKDEIIPFRAGGPFLVKVTAQRSELGRAARASLELLTGTAPMDSVIMSTVVMSDLGDGTLAGTTTLKWPPGIVPGEQLDLRAQVGDRSLVENVPLEPVTLSHFEQGLSSNGSQVVRTVCFESSASDGTLSLHLSGAKLASGANDGTIALSPGDCATRAINPVNPLSSARVEAIVTAGSVQVVASLQNTSVVDVYEMTTPQQGMLTLQLTTANPLPARLSIVELDIVALINGTPTKNISVTFQTVPNVTITPSSVVTNEAGQAKARFQMPENGSLSVIAVSGGVESVPIVFYP